MKSSAAVIGMGMVSGLGMGVATTFERLLAGESGLRPITRFAAEPYAQKQAGQLADEDEARLLDRFGDDDLTWGLVYQAAEEAMAGLPPLADGEKLGLVLATNFGIMETRTWCWQERLDTGELDAATFAAQQDVVATVARRVGADGPAIELSLSCASGAAALHVALEWLRAGRASRVLAVGYDVLSEYVWCGLANLRTITSDLVRPFDRRRQGTIFGEGAAAMLLSARPEDADHALGWLLGAATNNNAFHLTAPPKQAAGSQRVMAAATADAGLAPEAIDLICAHATGTTANDCTESAAIDQLVGHPVPVIALKANLGHLMGAAGLAEAILTLVAMRRGQAPPIPNLEQPDPACAVDAVRDLPRPGKFAHAVTNSAGIGGNNASVLLGLDPTDNPGVHVERGIAIRQWGWVLPGDVGHGDRLPAIGADALLARGDALADFSVKPYLQSVKGYLDPAAQYALAAARLALGDAIANDQPHERFAVVSVTQYGAPTSAIEFYRQMQTKGPRYASPLIFPHGYANTAPNLVAIEYNLGGPHLVLDAAADAAEAWQLALHLLRHGLADDVLFLAIEAAPPEALPDGWPMLNGAIAAWLTASTSGQPANAPRALPANRRGTLVSLV